MWAAGDEAASMLRDQLKRETAALHDRLEAHLGLLGPGLSMRRYRQVLETFYGFYAPVETSLARIAAVSPPHGFSLRSRSELLESDLQALGMTRRQLAELPRCVSLPPLSNPEQLAGCLYVLEGASLGGRVIARALDRDFGIGKDSGASFFVGDAEATPARWRGVLAWLHDLVQEGARSDSVVASARATFLAFAHWAEEQLVCWPPTNHQAANDRPG